MEARKIILVVDDEPDIRDAVAFNLEQEHYVVRRAEDGQSALAAARQLPRPDAVILDLMLPDTSGTEICRTLRADADLQQVPILMLTARASEIDRVVGFEVGADDYVTKPFSMRELSLRLRALLRRTRQAPDAQPADSSNSIGPLRVDAEAHQVWVEGVEVPLTALEFRLLETLMQRRARVQTRSALLEDVWGVHGDVTTRTVDTHVKRLREKLGPAASYIETIRGVGYRFRAPASDG